MEPNAPMNSEGVNSRKAMNTAYYPYTAAQICDAFEKVLPPDITPGYLPNNPTIHQKVWKIAEEQAHQYGCSYNGLMNTIYMSIRIRKPDESIRTAMYNYILSLKSGAIESEIDWMKDLAMNGDPKYPLTEVRQRVDGDQFTREIWLMGLNGLVSRYEFWDMFKDSVIPSRKHKREDTEELPPSKEQACDPIKSSDKDTSNSSNSSNPSNPSNPSGHPDTAKVCTNLNIIAHGGLRCAYGLRSPKIWGTSFGTLYQVKLKYIASPNTELEVSLGSDQRFQTLKVAVTGRSPWYIIVHLPLTRKSQNGVEIPTYYSKIETRSKIFHPKESRKNRDGDYKYGTYKVTLDIP